MATKLKKLMFDRVDLVPAGANPEADIVLFKSAEPPQDPPPPAPVEKATFDEIRDSRQLGKMLSQVCEYTWDLQDAIYSSMYSSGDRAAEVRSSVNQFSKAVDEALSSWLKGEPVDKAKQDSITEQLTKMRERLTTIVKEAAVAQDQNTETTPVAKGDEPIPANIQKILDAQTAALEKANSDNAQLKADLEKQKEEARIEKERRETAEFVTKAKTDIPNLAGTDADKGALLQKMDRVLDPETFEKVVSLLKAGDTAIRSLLTMEHGTDIAVSSGSAYDQLVAKADELRKATPSLSKEQAFTKACEANTDLYATVRKEQKAARSRRRRGEDDEQ